MKHLTPAQLEELKKVLLEERNDILMNLFDNEDSLSHTQEYVEDSGELAFDSFDKEIIGKLSHRQQETLQAIEKALRKIEEGNYGICEKQGEAIPYERLSGLPYTPFCRKCSDK